MTELIQVNNVTKRYKKSKKSILNNNNLTIFSGDIVGLIGENGAGKSTFLKLLTKAVKPTAGSILYKGIDIRQSDNQLADYGIMIQPVYLADLSVVDNLNFYLEIHGKEKYKSNIDKILEIVGLIHVKKKKPLKFSFGMKQRLSLAIAMIGNPRVLILDEPFVGLDPKGVNNLISILKNWASKNKVTMVISSHQLSELEKLCNRYFILENGYLNESSKEKIENYF